MTDFQPLRAHAIRWLMAILLLALAACGGGGGEAAPPGPTPISISTQPLSQTVVAGTGVTFTVTAAGDGPGYQWQTSTDSGSTWANVAGATSASYAIAAVDVALTGRQYRVTVSGSGNAVTSSAVTLTVTPAVTAPAITVQPADASAFVGGSVSFNVTASGSTPAYQWQSSPDGSTWTNLAGATSAALTLGPLVLADSGRRYRVVVSNSAASVNSNAALLTVSAAPVAPQIATQPLPASVTVPQTALFSVVASGTPAPSYQWQSSSNGGGSYTDITGATSASYTTPATVLADDGKLLRVHVSNSAGDIFSNGALLSVGPAPVAPSFGTSPQAQAVTAPAAATFTVSASGTPTPTLQWQQSSDGGASFSNINGATAASYTTPATTTVDHGKQFRAVASNSAGSVNSSAASLSVSAGTLSGVAAVGNPIVGGSVQVVCAAGPALATTTSGATGAWQVSLLGQTLPCAARVSGGTAGGVANAQSYVAIATATGTVNVTPLTDLLVANVVATSNPAGWFAGLATNAAPLAAVTPTQVTTALGRLATALAGLAPLAANHPVTTPFTAVAGNVSDDMLTALARALASSGVSYPSLLAAAAAPTFTAPGTLGTALTTAYASSANRTVPTGPGGSNTAGMGGYSLVLLAGSGTLTATGFGDVGSYLVSFAGMGTTATVPYSAATGTDAYGTLTADAAGNLWAVRNAVGAVGGGYQEALAIVKFPNAASGQTGLAPTEVTTLPAHVSVNFMAFDSGGNLWLDMIDLNPPNTSAARIVQYTAASGYTATGTVIAYSGNGGWTGGCEGAALAFSADGHLHSLESYSNGAGSCVMRVREYTAAGAVVPSRYFPNAYTGSDLGGDLAIDAAGNLWVFSASSGCTSAALTSCTQRPSIRKISPTGVLLQTVSLPNVQEAGSPAFDANGNLWFGANLARLKYCTSTHTQYVYELPAGASAPTVAFTHTGSCTTPLTYYFGVAINPRPPGLP